MGNNNAGKLSKDLEKTIKELEKEIEKRLKIEIPKIIDRILQTIEFQNQTIYESCILFKCSQSMKQICSRTIRRATIIELWRSGYLNEKIVDISFLMDEKR